jgi:two-component system sensor histidine kinase QseC
MFERVGRLIENERRFTADAAHELRTPLAALRAQAQVAKGAADDTARQHALDGVIEGCDRATRLVDQLLTLARLEPDTARSAVQCDLAGLAREVIAEVAPFAFAKQVDIELRRSDRVSIDAQRELLSVLLRNLVDNAVRYSPRGSNVKVDIVAAGKGAAISVTDEGPGVAANERARLGERFYRVLGTGQTGSGLGLSIVRRIAGLHCARLLFEEGDQGKGLRVIVEFPSTAAT